MTLDPRAEQDVSPVIRTILKDTLTERGLHQWWNARLRYLDGHRPCERWDTDRPTVLAAALAFTEGIYV